MGLKRVDEQFYLAYSMIFQSGACQRQHCAKFWKLIKYAKHLANKTEEKSCSTYLNPIFGLIPDYPKIQFRVPDRRRPVTSVYADCYILKFLKSFCVYVTIYFSIYIYAFFRIKFILYVQKNVNNFFFKRFPGNPDTYVLLLQKLEM